MTAILFAALRSGMSFGFGLLLEVGRLLALAWQHAGRAIATILAIGLGCLALVQCGEIKTLQAAHGELVDERDRLSDDLATCRGSVEGLMTSLNDQNARVAAISAESARRLAASEKALGEAERGRASAVERASRLLEPTAGADACARAYSAMEAVKEDLR